MNITLPNIFPNHLLRTSADNTPDWKQLPAHGGVYALSAEDHTIILLSHGENIRRSMQLRWKTAEPAASSSRRTDLTKVTRAIWWRPTFSQFETCLRYLEIAARLYPQEYRKMVGFGPAWYVTLDWQQPLPVWRVSSRPQEGTSICLGSLPTRAAAEDIIHGLEEQFDLCRYQHILERTPHGQACSYAEMGRCPAPCNGSVALDVYRQAIQNSAEFVLQDQPEWFNTLRTRMKQTADQRAFEEAGRLKEQLAAARHLHDRCRMLTRQLNDYRYLVVQRSGSGRSQVKPFWCAAGYIEEGVPLPLKEPRALARANHRNELLPQSLSSTVANWSRHLVEIPLPSGAEPLLAERMWLMNHFFRKRDVLPGLILHISELPSPGDLVQLIRDKFSVKKVAAETDT